MDFTQFKDQISKKLGLNLNGYKEKQLKRRIEHLMISQGFNGFSDYYKALINDEILTKKFLDKITINVSEFFRNKEIFDKLESDIIPQLLKKNNRLKIWSAGCSIGSEAYSIAMILDKLTPNITHAIHASDVDERILNEAKEAKYRYDLLKNVSQERLNKYFIKDEAKYQLRDIIKNRVVFKKHDLLKDHYEKDYDLIVCRNVTIYFTKETQNTLYTNFKMALKPGGILFIGATESILNYSQLGFEKTSAWFYQKPS
ncbi:CheR family methyltransferase [Desulfitibacter alkalitolerans]|uniref:CheR family methyltransferase n=1 Tax=Desulfitibacter alkalitolerans TaxID=264641 RepID=UPI00047F1329|nr:protein-glutamate O-methyltransferase CheR [Desulfitibacter alkalitolerans]